VEGVDIGDAVWCHEWAVEDDVVMHVALWLVWMTSWVCSGKGDARACGDIISIRAESIGIVGIETVCDCKVENGGGYEAAVG